jgi:anti-sigma-K factor RskA
MSEELDDAAAEYVLGTLPADERARFVERMKSDAALRSEVLRLQARLAPLDDAAIPETPRPEVWQAIERLTAGGAAGAPQAAPSNVVQLRRRVSFWRGTAFLAGALAAGLAAVVVVDRLSVPLAPQGGRYVAVVDSDGHEPALIAEVDTTTGIIRVRTVGAQTPAGHSLELWHVAEGHEPRSLGILKAGLDAQTIQDVASAGPVDGMIAVSVEPEGGSPSGAPTGPIVYTGKLIPVE